MYNGFGGCDLFISWDTGMTEYPDEGGWKIKVFIRFKKCTNSLDKKIGRKIRFSKTKWEFKKSKKIKKD